MEKPTRWNLFLKSIKFGFLPFSLIRYVRIVTSSGKEYYAEDQEQFKEIMNNITRSAEQDSIAGISFEFKNRKLKKEIQDFAHVLFEKYFPTKKK